MVQATAQLSAGSPPPLERKDTPSNASGRKSTPVLERWQSSAASTPSPPPIISPKPAAMRKSWTVEPSLGAETTPPRPVRADYTGRSLKSASSVPSLADAVAAAAGDGGSPRGRGLGSSTTMISYIKPLKTGDRPPTPPQDRARSRSCSRAASPERERERVDADADVVVDEMGMRVRARSKSRHRSRSRHRSKSREALREDVSGGGGRAAAGLPPVGLGKPLSHVGLFW